MKQIRATYYQVGKQPVQVVPDSEKFTLEELQKAVGGYIKIIPLRGELVIVCDEEGKLKNLPHNPLATHEVRGQVIADAIVGDALICDRDLIG